MRSRHFSGLFLLFFSLLVCVHAQARVAFFVVLPDNTVLTDFSDQLEKMGAVVRMRMPPNILTFEAEAAFDATVVGPVTRVYQNVIPLSELSTYGPLAEAAGIQWNRDMVKNASVKGFKTASTMRTQAAQSSLPSPSHVAASVNGNRVHATWDSLAGAAFYGVQLSKTATFADKIESASLQADIDLPRLETTGGESLYLRVKAVDNDLSGPWSAPVSIAAGTFSTDISVVAPVLSSPLDASQSDGFTVILEWIAAPSVSYRLQVAETLAFDAPVIDSLVAAGEFTIPSPLLKTGKTYFWRVRQWSSSGSTWSLVRKFTVTEPSHIENDAMINPEAPR